MELESISSSIICYLEEESESHLSAAFFQVINKR